MMKQKPVFFSCGGIGIDGSADGCTGSGIC